MLQGSGPGSGFGFKASGSGFRFPGVASGVPGSGFRFLGTVSGLGAQGLGYMVSGNLRVMAPREEDRVLDRVRVLPTTLRPYLP